MEPRFSTVAVALEAATFLFQALASFLILFWGALLMRTIFLVQALAPIFVLLLNSFLFNPVMMITSQIKKVVIFSTEKIIIYCIQQTVVGKIKDYLKHVKSTLHAVHFQTFLSGISWQLFSKLITVKKFENMLSLLSGSGISWQLFSFLPKLIPAKKFPLPSVELLVTLAWTPLVALDVAIQVCLLAYTMAFQCTLYLLYVGLFLLCHLVGDHSKLEKTGLPQKRIVVKSRAKKEDIANDASRTFTFFNMDSYIFNDVEIEEEDKMRTHSDESGYLSESELIVDDSF